MVLWWGQAEIKVGPACVPEEDTQLMSQEMPQALVICLVRVGLPSINADVLAGLCS